MPLPFISTVVREDDKNLPLRLGTPIEKNAPLTEAKLIALEKELKKKMQFYAAYPDLWVEEILIPSTSNFQPMTYQRLMMRQKARIPLNHVTGARGVSKTFVALLMDFHQAIFCPGSDIAFTAPTKAQAAQVAKQTVNDILARFPILQLELDGPVVGGKDYFEVRFKNKSKIEITAALESTRGRRFDGIDVDESRKVLIAGVKLI